MLTIYLTSHMHFILSWCRSSASLIINATIIPGPRKPKTMEAFLQFEVNKLKMLEAGVHAIDGAKVGHVNNPTGSFLMKATLLAVVLDYPGHVECTSIHGGSGSGYYGCSRCLIPGIHSKVQHKMIWKPLADPGVRRRDQDQVERYAERARLLQKVSFKGVNYCTSTSLRIAYLTPSIPQGTS